MISQDVLWRCILMTQFSRIIFSFRTPVNLLWWLIPVIYSSCWGHSCFARTTDRPDGLSPRSKQKGMDGSNLSHSFNVKRQTDHKLIKKTQTKSLQILGYVQYSDRQTLLRDILLPLFGKAKARNVWFCVAKKHTQMLPAWYCQRSKEPPVAAVRPDTGKQTLLSSLIFWFLWSFYFKSGSKNSQFIFILGSTERKQSFKIHETSKQWWNDISWKHVFKPSHIQRARLSSRAGLLPVPACLRKIWCPVVATQAKKAHWFLLPLAINRFIASTRQALHTLGLYCSDLLWSFHLKNFHIQKRNANQGLSVFLSGKQTLLHSSYICKATLVYTPVCCIHKVFCMAIFGEKQDESFPQAQEARKTLPWNNSVSCVSTFTVQVRDKQTREFLGLKREQQIQVDEKCIYWMPFGNFLPVRLRVVSPPIIHSEVIAILYHTSQRWQRTPQKIEAVN